VGAKFVFVGERRSLKAQAMGVRWEDGRLAARTLHDALSAAGYEPLEQFYVNLFRDEALVIDETALQMLRGLAARGLALVGMGKLVQAALTRFGLPYISMVHPAARGRIRRREVYQAHVAASLRRAQGATNGQA